VEGRIGPIGYDTPLRIALLYRTDGHIVHLCRLGRGWSGPPRIWVEAGLPLKLRSQETNAVRLTASVPTPAGNGVAVAQVRRPGTPLTPSEVTDSPVLFETVTNVVVWRAAGETEGRCVAGWIRSAAPPSCRMWGIHSAELPASARAPTVLCREYLGAPTARLHRSQYPGTIFLRKFHRNHSLDQAQSLLHDPFLLESPYTPQTVDTHPVR
jgi:hypothetical protein